MPSSSASAADRATVALASSASPDKAAEVVRAVEAAGDRALAVQGDAADPVAVKAAVAKDGRGPR